MRPDSSKDDRILFHPLPFPFLAEEAAPDSYSPASGVKLLGAPIGSDDFVADFLRERRERADNLLHAVEEMEDPHISTEIHRLCASVVQVVHIFRVNSPQQTKPLLEEFDARQQALTNRLLPDIPNLSDEAQAQAFLNRDDGGFGLVPARVVAVPAYVGSKVDTAHAVAQLPGQRTIVEMTAHVPILLSSTYEEHDVVPTDDLLVPSLLQNPGHNQSTISSALQKRRAAKFWPSLEAEPCTLSVADQAKLSQYISPSRQKRLTPGRLSGQHELPSSYWCLWLQVRLGDAVYEAPADGSPLLCGTCGKPMGRYGMHPLSNCGTGYGRIARHKDIAVVMQDEALVASGIPSRREEDGLLPGADDPSGDIYVPYAAGCSDNSFSPAAFDFTMHGAVPDNGMSSPLLIASYKVPGAAAHDAEKSKTAALLKRERQVALVLKTDKGISWKREF